MQGGATVWGAGSPGDTSLCFGTLPQISEKKYIL